MWFWYAVFGATFVVLLGMASLWIYDRFVEPFEREHKEMFP